MNFADSVGVVIVSYNSAKHLKRLLPILQNRVSCWVVDNASEDDTVAVSLAHGAQVISLAGNIGFGAAVNRALVHIDKPYVWLLNPDVYLNDLTVLDAMVDTLRSNLDLVAVGPVHRDLQGQWQPSFGLKPTFLREAGRKWMQRLLDWGLPLSAQLGKWFFSNAAKKDKELWPVQWLGASCLLARRGAVMHIGGFDSLFFLYYEDVDLGCRLSELGDLAVLAKQEVSHARGGSSETVDPLAKRLIRSQFKQSQAICMRRYMRHLGRVFWECYHRLYVF